MILTQQPNMAFRNDQYLNSGQTYTADPMIWDMPSSTGSSLLNSRAGAGASDVPPFASMKRPTAQSAFSVSSSNDFGASDSNYSAFSGAYGSSMFGGSRNEREFQRSGSPMNATGASNLTPNSSNISLAFGQPSSRPLTSNGSFSRSVSMGQPPSTTPVFSSYSTNLFAPSQYSGQTPSASSNMNMNAVNKVPFDELRNNSMKRPQDTKRATSTMGIPNYGSPSGFNRGNMFNSTNGSDGPIFDMSDFPSLSSRSRLDNSMSFASALTQGPKSGYGMNKQLDAAQEFQLHSEDFPDLPLPNVTGSLTVLDKEKSRILPGDASAQDRTTPNSAPVSSVNSMGQQLNYGQPSSTPSVNSYFQPSTPGLPQGMPPFRRLMTEAPVSPAAPMRRLEETKDFSSPSGTKPIYVPPSMVQDHFGLIGFLHYMKNLTTGSTGVGLTSVGCDLHALGLIFNPLDVTPKRFKGYPFLHSYISDACTAHICHLDVDVPTEYLVSISMPKEKVAPPRIGKFSEDLLFYLFYGFPGDIMQYAAALELLVGVSILRAIFHQSSILRAFPKYTIWANSLAYSDSVEDGLVSFPVPWILRYSRDWRFHKDEKIWITRIPNQPPMEKTTTYERGQYQYFDSLAWRKATKEMHVEYAKLDDKINFPTSALQLMPNFLHSLFN